MPLCGRFIVSGRGEDVVMSVQPRSWPEVSEQTVAVARAAFPEGMLAMRVRDDLPGLFADAEFASAFGVRVGFQKSACAAAWGIGVLAVGA